MPEPEYTVNDFLQVPYLDGGRTMEGLDCWGQVRLARAKLFFKDLLKSWGHVLCSNKSGMTDAFHAMEVGFKQVQPRPGAIACCFLDRTLLHVGLVVDDNGLLKVLHTSTNRGAHLLTIRRFNRLSLDVRYYDDCDSNSDHIPEPTR